MCQWKVDIHGPSSGLVVQDIFSYHSRGLWGTGSSCSSGSSLLSVALSLQGSWKTPQFRYQAHSRVRWRNNLQKQEGKERESQAIQNWPWDFIDLLYPRGWFLGGKWWWFLLFAWQLWTVNVLEHSENRDGWYLKFCYLAKRCKRDLWCKIGVVSM